MESKYPCAVYISGRPGHSHCIGPHTTKKLSLMEVGIHIERVTLKVCPRKGVKSALGLSDQPVVDETQALKSKLKKLQ